MGFRDECRKPFIVESELLFPRKFDQSRWVFCYDVDLAVRQVEWRLHGWGGPHSELITGQQLSQWPTEGWSEAFHQGSSTLWTLLEQQLEPDH